LCLAKVFIAFHKQPLDTSVDGKYVASIFFAEP
jgi:hypothetical protein